MRLFRVDEEGNYTEIKSTERRGTLQDLALIAQKQHGDGNYVCDMLDGNCLVFGIKEGKLDFDGETGRVYSAHDERPSTVYDRENPTNENVTDFGFYVSDEMQPAHPKGGNAYEEIED